MGLLKTVNRLCMKKLFVTITASIQNKMVEVKQLHEDFEMKYIAPKNFSFSIVGATCIKGMFNFFDHQEFYKIYLVLAATGV